MAISTASIRLTSSGLRFLAPQDRPPMPVADKSIKHVYLRNEKYYRLCVRCDFKQ